MPSGVRLLVQDSPPGSELALDVLRRTRMAAELCAAVDALLLATAAFTKQNKSENNAPNLHSFLELYSAQSFRNQRRGKPSLSYQARSPDSEMSCTFK